MRPFLSRRGAAVLSLLLLTLLLLAPAVRNGAPAIASAGLYAAVDQTAVATTGVPTQTPVATTTATAQIVVSPTIASPGDVVQVNGQNFQPGEVVKVAFGLQPGTNVVAAADGLLPTTAITVPLAAAIGSHVVYALGLSSNRWAVAQLSVQALQPQIRLNATAYEPGRPACVQGTGFGRYETVTVSVNDISTTSGQADGSGNLDVCYVTPTAVASGDNTVTAQGTETRAAASTSFTGVPPIVSTYYFAGGSTIGQDKTALALLNAGPLRARVTLTFYTRRREPTQQVITMTAHALATVDVVRYVGTGNAVGIQVAADQVVAAQMVVHRGAGLPAVRGGGSAPYSTTGVAALSTTWYLSDGNTSGTFHEFLHVLNPQGHDALVIVQAFPEGGGRPHTLIYTVPARRVATLELNRLYPHHAIASIVSSTYPVMVTRVQTFGPRAYGANAGTGIAQTQTDWRFADGSVANGAQTDLSIFNPSARRRASVTVKMYDNAGQQLFIHTERVLPKQRATIRLNDLLALAGPAAGSGGFQIAVKSTIPLVVERAMYYGNPDRGRVASSVVTAPAKAAFSWSFAAGDTSGGLRENLVIANPNTIAAPVRATFFLADGTTKSLIVTAPARGRTTIDVATMATDLPPSAHGVQLASLLPIVAEQGIFTPGFTAGYATVGLAQ